MTSPSSETNQPALLAEDEFIPLPKGLEGWDILHSTTSPEGAVILLVSQFEEAQPDLPRGTSEFWVGWRDQVKRFRVYRWTEDAWRHFEIPPTTENYGRALPLPEGEWLLIWRWSQVKETGQNAHVYVPGTGVVRTFDLYPGFTDLGITESGIVWIGYDDMTVQHFHPKYSVTPPWDSGLVALDGHGRVLFDFDRLGLGPNTPLPFEHCYALNVVDDHEVWVYYWRQFSLLRLIDYRIEWRWDTIPLHFANAFAVATDGAPQSTVLLGAIDPRHSLLYRLYFYSLHKEELIPTRASGERIRYVDAFGRGDRLYLRHSEGYSVFRVEGDG